MNTDHYISLIYKELKGIISLEEVKQLSSWELQSSKNQKIATEIRQVWLETEQYEIPFDLDHDSDFAKIKLTINIPEVASNVIPIQSRRRLWINAVAAAAIVLLSATFLFQNYFQDKEQWVEVESGSEIIEFKLPDGSNIWLNAGSKLSYPSKFSINERLVKLTGEAFFEVSKKEGKPFQVTTNRITVTVLGTQFNVRDIANEKTFEVAVQEGKVKVQKNESTQKVILEKNEKAIYDEGNHLLNKLNDKNLNQLSWKRKRLKFNNTALQTALNKIAVHYNINIKLENKSIKDCHISGSYSTKTEVLKLLQQVTTNQKIKIKKLNETEYKLTGGTCK